MTYTLTDVVNSVIQAFTDMLGYVAAAISANAENIANILVLGMMFGISVAVLARYGRGIWDAILGFVRAFRV